MTHPSLLSRATGAFLLAAALLLGGCRFELERELGTGELRGRAVLAGAGATLPAAGALVQVEGSPITVRADADGKFVVRALTAGTYALRITSGTDAGVRLRGIQLEDGLDLGAITLGLRGRLEGSVVRGADPVRGRVVLSGVAETPVVSGAYAFASVLPGKYEVYVQDPSGALVTGPSVDVKPRDATRLDLDLATLSPVTTASLTGHARLSGGAKHGGIEITLLGAGVSATTGDSGIYAAVAEPGVFTLLAQRDGFRPILLPSLVLGGDEPLPDLLLLPGTANCEAGGTAASADDRDADGTPDATEPEPCRCAPGTTDVDADGICDDADRDVDDDGVDDAFDNCPGLSNYLQHDNDGDFLGDACDPDHCTGVTLDCTRFDGPCSEGACDPATGECAATAFEDGATCDDGDACTTGETCAEGACRGTAVDCSAKNAACAKGVCDPADGTCKVEVFEDDTGCDDGDRCTTGDVCAGGTCAGVALDCSAFTDACHTGYCDTAEGQCRATSLDGNECDDGDLCTFEDACSDGTCRGTTLDCSALDGTCLAGECNPSTGSCEAKPANAGGSCSDDNSCTWGDTCVAGRCGVVTRCLPGAVVNESTANAPPVGTPGGNVFEFDDGCYGTDVLVGINARVADGPAAGGLFEFSAVCAEITVSAADPEPGWKVTFSPSTGIPFEGSFGSGATGAPTSASRTCPAGQAISGFVAGLSANGTSLGGVEIQCAPLVVSGDPVTGFTTTVGASTKLPVLGSATSGLASTCPAGTLARGLFGHVGTQLETLGVRCLKPAPWVVTTSPLTGVRGGNLVFADCPKGQLPSGLGAALATGFYSGSIGQWSMQCADLLRFNGGSGWEVSVYPYLGVRVPTTGVYGAGNTHSGVQTLACPAGKVVVGAAFAPGRIGVGGIAPRCAEVLVDENGVATGHGPIEQLGALGIEGVAQDCPDGTTVVGFELQTGDILDGIAVRCAPWPSISIDQGA